MTEPTPTVSWPNDAPGPLGRASQQPGRPGRHGANALLDGIVNTLELLVAIDTTTGLATAVGTIAWDTGVYFGNVPDMSFDSTGNLYVWREPCDDDLYRVDKTTAVATRVGEAGVGTAAVGLAFDSTDTLYMKTSNTLYTVDTTTGATSFQVSASFGVRLVNRDFRFAFPEQADATPVSRLQAVFLIADTPAP